MSATQGVLVLLALMLAAGQALADSADENIETAIAKADVAEVADVDEGAEGADEAKGEKEIDTVVSGGAEATKGLLHCTYERPVGSHIPKRVCRTVEQRENDRFIARRQVQQATVAREQLNRPRGR